MPRFVILEHDWPTRHWDLLLEAEGVLKAWRLLAEPAPGREVPAEPNADHRLLFLDYEGPVSGGRGEVKRWAAGRFDWITNEATWVVVDAVAEKLTGRFMICEESDGRWVFRWTIRQVGR